MLRKARLFIFLNCPNKQVDVGFFFTTEDGKNQLKSIKKLTRLDHCEAQWIFSSECSLMYTRNYKWSYLLCLVKQIWAPYTQKRSLQGKLKFLSRNLLSGWGPSSVLGFVTCSAHKFPQSGIISLIRTDHDCVSAVSSATSSSLPPSPDQLWLHVLCSLCASCLP